MSLADMPVLVYQSTWYAPVDAVKVSTSILLGSGDIRPLRALESVAIRRPAGRPYCNNSLQCRTCWPFGMRSCR